MKLPLHSKSEFRYSVGRDAIPDAVTAWHIETRFRYLADRNEWHCRHVVARASLSDEQRTQHDENDLDALIHELSDSVRHEAKACGVTFRLEVVQDLAQIRFDHAQMGNVLVEMVHDALRGLALGQVEARELVARITLTPSQEIAISVDLRR
jgi:hypothetical protein